MSFDAIQIFWPYCACIILLCVIGLYCVLATFTLIRALIGVELLLKAVSLLIIVAGRLSGRLALAQALVITFIVIEVVVMTVALGIVMGIQRHNKSLNVEELKNAP
jgi:multisubunit Na+/H+ antiporter MnhC subunit